MPILQLQMQPQNVQWYSTLTWECHTLTHSKENLPIHPDDPAFLQQFSKTEAIPSTSGSISKFPHAEAVCKHEQKLLNSFWKKEVNNLPSTVLHLILTQALMRPQNVM